MARTLNADRSRLTKARRLAGYSQAGLVRHVCELYRRGVVRSSFSLSTYKRMERGMAVYSENLNAAAVILDVPLTSLVPIPKL